MNRNRKLAIAQISFTILSLIIGIVSAVLVAMKTANIDSIVKTMSYVIIAVGIISTITAIIQIIFGAQDKMWLGMSAGIVATSGFALHFAHTPALTFIAGITTLILNIITIVKAK